MNPLPNAEKFIRDTLKNNGGVAALVGTRIYSGRPPRNATYPCIVFSHSGGGIEAALHNEDVRVAELPIYLIKAVTKGDDYGDAHELTNAFDEALRNARGPVTYSSRTVQVQGVKIQTRIEYQEDDEQGTRYNHVGATYRLFLSGF